MKDLLDLVRSSLSLRARESPTAESAGNPRYGTSVSYGSCPACGEGSLVYDADQETTVCNVCGSIETESSE